MEKVVYIKYGENHSVIDFYLSLIVKAFESKGYCCKEITSSNVDELDRKAPVIVGTGVHLVQLYFRGFRKFISWFQGTPPNENYMRNGSVLKRFILHRIESFALKHSIVSVFVSKAQLDYYIKEYGFTPSKYYIMPCYNCHIEKAPFFTKDKYANNVFCYVGSLAAWQYFEETISYYKRIEDKYGDRVFLKIFTPEIDAAREKVNNIGIKNVEIGFVSQDKLNDALATCKYGFILREDNIVNNVATPTKLSTYLANGVIPIFSDSIHEYVSMMSNSKYSVCVDNLDSLDNIGNIIERTIDASDVFAEYSRLFDMFYNDNKHTENIKNLL